MKPLIRDHPVLSRLYGVGLPGWLGFAVAGWPLAIIAGGIALTILVWPR